MAVYKNPKTNIWCYRVYYTDIYGNRKQKYKTGFPTKKIAKEFELDFLNSPNYNNLTFLDLYTKFIEYKELRLKPGSIRSIKSRFKTHILPYFGNMLVSKIDGDTYNNWKKEILKKNFSYKYNSSLHVCMVDIINYAIKFYNFEKNIPSLIGNFQKYNYIPNNNFWTYEEYKSFISCVNEIEYYSLFQTLYFTGMRIGEALALTWDDIKENYINVNKSLSKEKKNDKYIITIPKTHTSIRKINIDEKTKQVLNNLKNYYKQHIGFKNEWFVFGGITPKSRTTIERIKNNYCKIANVKQIKMHDFRHSHASLLLSKGVPILVISKRLGHKNTSTTLNIYSHLIPEDEDKAIQLLNQLNTLFLLLIQLYFYLFH